MKSTQLEPIKKARFKKGDQVQVTTGKSKGSIGEVLQVDPKRHLVMIKEVNMIKRHSKPRTQEDPGGIISMEAPLHMSNVLPYCDACGRGVRKVCEKSADCKNYKKRKGA